MRAYETASCAPPAPKRVAGPSLPGVSKFRATDPPAEALAVAAEEVADLVARVAAVFAQRVDQRGDAPGRIAFVDHALDGLGVWVQAPLTFARSMLSLGILASRAFYTAVANAALLAGSPPPSRAATWIARRRRRPSGA